MRLICFVALGRPPRRTVLYACVGRPSRASHLSRLRSLTRLVTRHSRVLLRCARPPSSTYCFVRLRRPAFARLASEPPAKSHPPCNTTLASVASLRSAALLDVRLCPPASAALSAPASEPPAH